MDNRCPVCQARFRGAADCSRCGADLRPLMRIAVRAWQAREAVRTALQRGEVNQAAELAAQARALQAHDSADSLVALVRWLEAFAH